jgi:3-deoxy-manno-octulosonate cytidylyltransferase (CMP-KDO synthetase)
MSFKVVIPARHGSSRLPGKPLLEIAGKPMIRWVIEAALRSQADEVLVATDDRRIADAAFDPRRSGGSLAIMTRSDHTSGTDRIAEVAAARHWPQRTVVVNLQGDEPQMPALLIDQVAGLLDEHPAAEIATLCTPITSILEFLDPNVVKVVTGRDGMALYFSRAPIPWHRDGAVQGLTSQTSIQGARRHLGIYAYRVAALQQLTVLPPSDLEVTERLEQLRALQSGMRIAVGVALEIPATGVDTEEDLGRVRRSLHREV